MEKLGGMGTQLWRAQCLERSTFTGRYRPGRWGVSQHGDSQVLHQVDKCHCKYPRAT